MGINTSENEAKLTNGNGYDRLHFVVLLSNEDFNQHFKTNDKTFKDKKFRVPSGETGVVGISKNYKGFDEEHKIMMSRGND